MTSISPISFFRVIIRLFAAAFLFSCSQPSPVREQLSRAEQVMETDCRAAAAVLDSIDSSALRGEDAALYAILRTQTDYKRDIPLTSDSLAHVATDYYGTSLHKNYHAAMAWYTLGCVYTDQKNDAKAVEAYLKAKDCFPDTTNRYFGLTMQNLGQHYINRNMLEEAISSLNSYYNISHATGDTTSLFFAEYFLGIAYLRSFEYDRADSLFDRVLKSSINQPYCKWNALLNKAKIECYHRKDYVKATSLVDSYRRQLNNDYHFGAGFYLLGDIYKGKEMLDSARYYYRKASACKEEIYTKCNTYKALVETSLMQDGKTDVLEELNSYGQALDSIYERRNRDAMVSLGIQHEMDKQEMKHRSDKRMLQLYLLILFVVLVLLASIVFLLNDRRRKSEKLKYEKELDDIKRRYILENVQEGDADEEESSSDGKDAEEREENAVPLPPRFSIQQERLRLYRRQYDASEWARYFRNRQLEIKSGSRYMPADDSEKFLSYLNALFTDVFLDMANDNPGLTRQDMEYCAMVMLGLETNQIAYSSRTSTHSCYNRRYRLRERLKKEWYRFVFFSFGG